MKALLKVLLALFLAQAKAWGDAAKALKKLSAGSDDDEEDDDNDNDTEDEEESEDSDDEDGADEPTPAKVKKADRAKLVEWAKAKKINTKGKTVKDLREELLEVLKESDDEDEESEDDDEDEDEKPKGGKKKRPTRRKSSKDDDEDEDEDDDDDESDGDESDDDDDDDEDEPKKGKSRRRGGSPGKAVAAAAGDLKLLQKTLLKVIQKHDLEDEVEELGCGGNCYKCPHPEEPTVEKQVRACLTSIKEEKGLEYSEKIEEILAA